MMMKSTIYQHVSLPGGS